jgi:hypothetical protein
MSLHLNCQRAVDRIAKANALVPRDRRAEIEVLLDRVTLRVGLFREIFRDEPRIAGARKEKSEHNILLPACIGGRLFENRQPIPCFGARSKLDLISTYQPVPRMSMQSNTQQKLVLFNCLIVQSQ